SAWMHTSRITQEQLSRSNYRNGKERRYHECMDAAGRAKQDARAEGLSLKVSHHDFSSRQIICTYILVSNVVVLAAEMIQAVEYLSAVT
ncbi:MAG: hypothetical protein MJK12_04800, partial [Colwellia sp.]|nr:hypothetical protein [Colwellia sp.]